MPNGQKYEDWLKDREEGRVEDGEKGVRNGSQNELPRNPISGSSVEKYA
jgi:hypothetical protein